MTPTFELFHPQTLQAIHDLMDLEKSVSRPLVAGAAAGKLDLIHALFPPREIHRNSVPARFSFVLEDEYCSFELQVMVSLVDAAEENNLLAFGLLSHDQLDSIRRGSGANLDATQCFAAVKYSPLHRRGSVFLCRTLYDAIVASQSAQLEIAQRVRQRREEGREYSLPG